MDIRQGFIESIGNTPLIRLTKASDLTQCEIYGKAEFLNPGGSVKDRAALAIVKAAETRGDLRPGGIIVEGTAGNTGIGLALVGDPREGLYVPFVGDGLAAGEGLAPGAVIDCLGSLWPSEAGPGRSWCAFDSKQTLSAFAELGLALPLPSDDIGLAAQLVDPLWPVRLWDDHDAIMIEQPANHHLRRLLAGFGAYLRDDV